MIIFENGTWQTNSEFPNLNYLENLDCSQPSWVIPDDSELANKIKNTEYYKPVSDENGNLIDIIESEPELTPEQRIADLKAQLVELDLQAIRPLRAMAAGTSIDEDTVKLTELEMQAEKLRAELAELGKENINQTA